MSNSFLHRVLLFAIRNFFALQKLLFALHKISFLSFSLNYLISINLKKKKRKEKTTCNPHPTHCLPPHTHLRNLLTQISHHSPPPPLSPSPSLLCFLFSLSLLSLKKQKLKREEKSWFEFEVSNSYTHNSKTNFWE